VQSGTAPLGQLPGTGNEVGVNVGLAHVRNPEAFFPRRLEITVDVPVGVYHHRPPSGRTSDQVTRLGELGFEEPAEDQARPPRFASRRTNLRPDHTSSMAQTFTSTRP
jgi:hypothetical protein